MNTLIVLVIILIIFSVWNLISLYELKKYNRSYRELKDDRYYELKYKLEYITAIVVVVIGVGAFFGYRFFEEFKKNTSENLKTVTENYEVKLKSIGKIIESKEFALNDNSEKQNSIEKRVKNSDSLVTILTGRINVISNKSIVKQDIYLVDKIFFKFPKTNMDTCRFYYKDLTSIKGEKLPIFNEPPFLAIVPESPADFVITEKKKDYFKLEIIGGFGDLKTVYFGIMVSQK